MNDTVLNRFDALLRGSCAVGVVLFGCWTMLANAVTLSENSFADLRRLAPVALIAAVAILAYLCYDRTFGMTDLSTDSADSEDDSKSGVTLLQLLIGAGLAAVFAFGKQYLIFWVLTVIYLSGAYWRGRYAPMLRFREASSHSLNYLVFAIGAIVVVLAAFWLNRPDADDSLYINMAVSALDNPGTPIYASDGLHGIPGAYYLPTYRVQAFELLAALFAQTFKIAEPIGVFHLLLAPLFTLFSVCAGAVCLKRLQPQQWGWASFVLAATLLILRSTHRMYGNFAYVRMFQGKSIFVTAMIPLIVVYAADFFAQPSPGNWLLLMLAQVCAVGFTANALYAAPIAAGLALVACWRPSGQATRRLGLGLLASIYPVILSLIIRSIMIRDGLGFDDFQQFIPIDMAANLVLGEGATLWFWLLGLTSAWCLVKDRGTRQWVLGFCLGFILICMNPFLDEYWGLYVTAKYLTWRLFWVIPLPIFLSLFVTRGVAGGFDRARGILVFICLALLLLLTFGKPWNDPRLMPELRIGLKVPQPDYEVARRLNEIGGGGNPVLAPENISEWVPTFRGHAYPLVTRAHYTEALLSVFASRVDTQDLRERLALAAYVNDGSSDNHQSEVLLRRWLEANKISAVAVRQNHSRIVEITQILDQAGFDGLKYLGYVIFHR